MYTLVYNGPFQKFKLTKDYYQYIQLSTNESTSNIKGFETINETLLHKN